MTLPSGCYTADLLLKQGAYNYMYLWVPDGTAVGQTGKIEGDHYETVNEYLVKVYDRPMGERYDRLVGYGVAYSGKKSPLKVCLEPSRFSN